MTSVTSVKPRGVVWYTQRIVLPTLFVALLAWFIVSRRDALEPLKSISVAQVGLVLALTAAAHWLNATEFALIYRSLGAKVSLTENWLLFTAGQLGNYLPAQAGTIYRFRYLASVHNLTYAQATAGYGANLILTLLSTGGLGLAACAGLYVADGTVSYPLIAAFGALVAVAVAVYVLPLPMKAGGTSKVARFARGVAAGWGDLRRNPRLGVAVLGLELAKYLTAAIRMQLIFGWLGYDEHLYFFLVLAPVAGLATFIGLTPASLGFREVGIAGSTIALGRSLDEGLLGASLDRGAVLIVSVVFGAIGFVYTGRRLAQAAQERTDNSEG